MAYVLFTIFLGVPLIEIGLFIVVGREIGVLATMAAVVATALAGAFLVRRQGLATLERARGELERDHIPAGALGEGLAILVAGALLLTPGFFTDAIGFALLVPPLRRSLIAGFWRWLGPQLTVVVRERHDGGRGRGPIIEGEAIEIDDDKPGAGDPGSPWRRR